MLSIDRERCDGCGLCVDICPNNAIDLRDKVAFINYERCEECLVCLDECPQFAITATETFAPQGYDEISVVEIPEKKIEVLPSTPEKEIETDSLGVTFRNTITDLLPRLASLAVDWLENRSTTLQESNGYKSGSSRKKTSPRQGQRGRSGQHKRRQQRNRTRKQ